MTLHKQKQKKVKTKTEMNDFYFKPKLRKINWRLLSGVSVEDIVTKNNVNDLQNYIEIITFANLDGEEVDPQLLKLFQLSQLIVEFLLYSQDCLLKEREDEVEQMELITHQKSKLEKDLDQLTRQLQESQKECKSLKKQLFVYEIMSKKPAVQGKGSDYYVCQYCPKAFSTLEFRIAHEKRRHSSLISDDEKVEEKPSKEFQKVVELIELMTKTTQQQVQEKEAKEAEVRAAERLLEQEKLRYEKQLQELTTKMHQKMEEEMSQLKQDREAFEKLVSAQGKHISHVGNLEDDDEELKKEKDLKHKEEILQLQQQHQHELDLVQQRMIQEMQILKESMRLEQLKYSKSWEEQLAQAAREIDYLKSKQQSTQVQPIVTSVVEPVVTRNVSIQEINLEPEVKNPAPVIIKDEPPLPPKITLPSSNIDMDRLYSPTVNSPTMNKLYNPSPTTHLTGWKQYLDVLKKSAVRHPQNKHASGMYQHHITEINGKKELLQLEMDSVFTEFGLTPTTVSKNDPSVQVCLQRFDDALKNGRDQQRGKLYYDEMRNYLETVIDQAASQTKDVTTPVAPPVTTPSILDMNRKSSLKKTTGISPKPKVVRIVEQKEERQIVNQAVPVEAEERPEKPKIKIPIELQSPVEKETFEALEKLKSMAPDQQVTPNRTPNNFANTHVLSSPYSQYFGTPTSPLKRSLSNTKEKVGQVLKVAKSLFQKKVPDTRFEQAMAKYSGQNPLQPTQLPFQTPTLPFNQQSPHPASSQEALAKYSGQQGRLQYHSDLKSPTKPPPPVPKDTTSDSESSYYTSSKSKDEDSSSSVSIPKNVVVVKPNQTRKSDDDLSFSISDPTHSSDQKAQETDDEDLLEFLEEIDISKSQPTKSNVRQLDDISKSQPTKSNVPQLDDIDDFDD